MPSQLRSLKTRGETLVRQKDEERRGRIQRFVDKKHSDNSDNSENVTKTTASNGSPELTSSQEASFTRPAQTFQRQIPRQPPNQVVGGGDGSGGGVAARIQQFSAPAPSFERVPYRKLN